LIKNKSEVAFAPNGNGGMYMAMRDDKVLDHIVKNGVEYIHMANIDNIL